MAATASQPLRRQFNAINGRELIALVLADLKKQLEDDDNFQESQTYPVVEYYAVLKIKAYPRTPPEFDVKIKGMIAECDSQSGQPKDRIEDLGPAASTVAQTSEIIDTQNPPDKARESAGLPVMIPGKSPVNGSIVSDIPTMRPGSGPQLPPGEGD